MEYTIEAKNKAIGRVATEAAQALMGKKEASFERRLVADVKVIVENAAHLRIGDKKRLQKIYFHHTGRPGGDRYEKLESLIERKGYGEAIRRAVYGMLPKNTLRDRRMKRLVIHEGAKA